MTFYSRRYDSYRSLAGSLAAAMFVLAICSADAVRAQPAGYSDERATPLFGAPRGALAGNIFGRQRAAKEQVLGITPEQLQAAGLLSAFTNPEGLQRRPGAVLKAMADRAAARKKNADGSTAVKDPNEAAAEKAQEFQYQFITGDWGAIGERLAKLPTAAGPIVYSHLLTLLSSDPQMVLLPDEFLPLADAAPTTLNEQQLALLGQLLKRIAAQTSRPDALIDNIEQGSKRLGGDDPQNRLAAARLLIAAEMLEPAGAFLPPLATVLKEGDPQTLNMYALHQLTVAARGTDNAAYQRAWQLTLMSLESKAATADTNLAALERAMTLLPKLPRSVVSGWLRDLFQQRPAAGMRLLSLVGDRVPAAFAAAQPNPRLAALKTQQMIVDELLTVAATDSGNWNLPLQVLVGGWINEAQKTVGGYRGSMMVENESEIPPLPAAGLLAVAPSTEWRDLLNSDVAWHVRQLTGQLASRTGKKERAFAIIRGFVRHDKDRARQLAQQYLTDWVQRQNGQVEQNEWANAYGSLGYSSSQMRMMRMQQMWNYGGNSMSEEAIPLTRAKQAGRIAELAELLSDLAAAGVPAIETSLPVNAFGACHSDAEIYLADDIEKVFGPAEQMPASITRNLVSKMRRKLAGQWRRPEIQQQARTRRTDEELIAEISRGYELATDIATAAFNRFPQDTKLAIALATVLFDQAEFLYGQKVDLKTYISLRDRSFGIYRKAADSYVAALPTMAPKDQSIDVFRQWFQSSLGASDLAYLSRQDVPQRDQIDQIAAAFAQLNDETGERHRKLFGGMLTSTMNQVPSHLKPWFLREGLRVLGDHPSGERARRRLEYYDDLLTEISLHVEVDGRAEVGHRRPFGVRLSIRNTTAVGRESGGFAYLLDTTYSMSSGTEYDPRKKLEAELREKLSEAFEIDVIRFHEPTVVPRRFGRAGWRETPLAYLILRAKDPSVDRLPTVSIDLEFSDGAGAVMLPIPSQVALIDARDDEPPLRPAENIVLQQTLDTRPLASDEPLALLEVTATTTGLPPELERLLNVGEDAIAGFRITKVEDHGLDVTALDDTGKDVQPLCRRSWSLELAPSSKTLPATFAFPTVNAPTAKVKYERYDDADIVETADIVPLAAWDLTASRWLWPSIAAAGLFVLLLCVLISVRRRRRPVVAGTSKFRRPNKLTPFTLMLLLETIREDESLQLEVAEQESLNATIGDLERSYFHRNRNGENGVDLETVFDNWFERVSVRWHA